MADHDLSHGDVAGAAEDGVHTGQGHESQRQEPQLREAQPQQAQRAGLQHQEPGAPRLFGQPAPSAARAGPGAQEPWLDPELPDAFAPGVALGGLSRAGAEAADAEPGDTADPYGSPDDYDTAEAYVPADDHEGADEYDSAGAYLPEGGYDGADPYGSFGSPGSSGRGSSGPDEDYDAGDEYRPPDGYGVPAGGSSLSLIRNSGGPPAPFGSSAAGPAGPGPYDSGAAQRAGAAEPGAADAGPAELRPAMPPGPPAPGTAAPGTAAPGTAAPGTAHSSPRTVTADTLTTDLLLPGRHEAPSGGWRRAIFEVTGGLVRAPESAAQRRREELAARARTPVAGGHHRVAVLSLKGGVGKTTTTVGLGATLASLRGDRVIAVDASPGRGTLSDKLRPETSATVRDLLNERDQIQRYADVRAYTTQAPNRLEVLASDRDPTVSVAFGEQDYCDVARVLEHYYSICLTDCGTGLLHSAMTGVLRLADQIVLVSSPSVDGARSASATLDWLQAHGYGDLVRRAVVVLAVIRPRGKSAVDLERLEQHFAARCRAVVGVPYDAHLDEGAEVELGRLSRATADAFLVLAAETGDGFARPPRAAS